jgi:hypothetical protein
MKASRFIFPFLALLLLAACGKQNESGRSRNTWDWANPYSTNPMGTNLFATGGFHPAVQQLIQGYPCQGANIPYGMPQQAGRLVVQIPLLNSSIVNSVQPYIGVTGYGDVATIVSSGPNQPPMFIAYLCPRSFTQAGQGQLLDLAVGSYGMRCRANPQITRATMILPGNVPVYFRSLDGGAYNTCMGMMGSPSCQYFPGYCQ